MNLAAADKIRTASVAPAAAALLAVVGLLCSPAAVAQPAAMALTTSPSITLSGYGSVGLVQTEVDQPWRFSRELMGPGAGGKLSGRVDTRAALQASLVFTDQIEAMVQLLARSRLNGADSGSDALQMAFLKFRLQPDLSLRLGRTSPDVFLFSETRNVGMAMPWVRPPVEFYGWIPFDSVDGADLQLRTRTADANWNLRLTFGHADTLVNVVALNQPLRLKGRNAAGLSVARESGGLLLRAGYLRTNPEVSAPPQFEQLNLGLQSLSMLPVPGLSAQIQQLQAGLGTGPIGKAEYLTVGLQYDTAPWEIHAEYSDVTVGKNTSSGRRGYLSLGRHVGPVVAYALYAWSRPKDPPVTAPQLAGLPGLDPLLAAQGQALLDAAAVGANVPRSHQASLGVGLRWNVASNVALKFQVDRVRVQPFGAAHWVHSTPAGARATVATALVDFTWGQ